MTKQDFAPDAQAYGGSGEIRLCPDGKFRWVYEFPMLKNPTILFTILKIMALCVGVPALVTLLSGLGDGFLWALKGALLVYLICMGIVLVLSVIGYLITAAVYGWKYIVLFEMDDEGIRHIQQSRQFKKAQGIAWLTTALGAAAGNTGAVGTGLLASSKNAVTSEFRIVSKVIGLRRRNTIKLSELFAKNQIYVDPRDYDFVWGYITTRCKKAKIK